MPRCQRTFRRLGAGEPIAKTGQHRWVCPFCPDSEVYETILSPDLLEFLAQAEAICQQEFGPPADFQRPVLLIAGLSPECIREPDDRRYDIYLQRGSDTFQLRLQLGHEIFHRFCSRGRIFHWTHEMLACLFSVRLLRLQGTEEYADTVEQEYARHACLLSVEAMLAADLSLAPYPQGLYGRAFITGKAMENVVGWENMCRLARCLNVAGLPDVDRWAASLPSPVRSSLRQIFTAIN